ncbi:hypothetical protein [Arthrobacter sp. ISL-5]|uniref:hypothetical protein n=1 Tax=Arthrobacter sp. ISL-5 TaxID=2819111 RepID=UPI001BE90DD4|nr:hypothetical protein [Arthrobacter sp. ISL-5]MBT2551647.1 hypothetical protein [Arthrobacter sp. ISL-5]
MDSGAPGDIPAAIRISTACWLTSAVVFGIVPVILDVAGIKFGQSMPDWAVPFIVAFAVPLTALQVWAAVQLQHGAGWARLLLTAAAVVSVLAAPLAQSALILAGLVLTLAGAVLMWLPVSSRHFLSVRDGAQAEALNRHSERCPTAGP